MDEPGRISRLDQCIADSSKVGNRPCSIPASASAQYIGRLEGPVGQWYRAFIPRFAGRGVLASDGTHFVFAAMRYVACIHGMTYDDLRRWAANMYRSTGRGCWASRSDRRV